MNSTYSYLCIIGGNFTLVNGQGTLHQISREVVDNPDYNLEDNLSELLKTGAIGALREIVEVQLNDNVISSTDSLGNTFKKENNNGNVT